MTNRSSRSAAKTFHPRLPALTLAFVAVILLAAPALVWPAEECFECHGLRGLATPGHPLWLKAEGFAASPHGRLTCSDCHKGTDTYPHDSPRVRCDLPCHVPGANHEALARAEERGVHARLGAPPCVGCHSAEKVPRGDKAEALCLSCHGGIDRERRIYPDSAGAFGFWAHRRIGQGKRTPRCPDCHGLHAVRPASLARAACKASGCHPGAGERFGELFDHRSAPGAKPWGGAGPAALLLLATAVAALALHARRG